MQITTVFTLAISINDKFTNKKFFEILVIQNKFYSLIYCKNLIIMYKEYINVLSVRAVRLISCELYKKKNQPF